MEAGGVQEEPLSPSSRLFHYPHFNVYIVAMMGSGKRIDVDVVKAGLEVTLLRHPRFSSLQVFEDEAGKGGKGRWVRTKVCLDDHLVVPDLEASAIADPDLFVEDYISALTGNGGLDPSRPLWQLHILNLRTSDAEATAVFRIHHSLGDGAALINVLLACTRTSSNPSAPPSVPDLPFRRPWTDLFASRGRFLRLLLAVVVLARVAWNTIRDVACFLATVAFLRDTETAIKGREGCEFGRRRFLRRSFPLDDLRVVRSAMDGVTVNDVLLGVFSAGLSRYICRRSGVSTKSCFGSISQQIRLRSALLFNTRRSPGTHALADMMEDANMNVKLGNQLGYVLFPFPIVKNDDPLHYVMECKKIADRKKASLEAYFSFSCGKLALNLFGIKAAGAISYRVLSNTTFSFSNVVGPTEEIGFFDHPMVYLAPTAYGHPHALTVHFLSYMGRMMMVLAVDESVIPDPHQLCEDILEALCLIKAAAASKASSKQSHSKVPL